MTVRGPTPAPRPLSDLLEAQPTCPICGGAALADAPGRTGEPGYYANVMLAHFAIDEAALRDTVTLKECAHCGTYWHDPWLARSVVAAVYHYGAGLHREGWFQLRDWMDGTPRADDRAKQLLLDLVRRLVPGMTDYAEVACPFSGLMPLLTDDRLVEPGDRALLKRKISWLGRLHTSTDLRREHREVFPAHPLVNAVSPPNPAAGRPQRWLLLEPSDLCWGSSCIVFGAGCQALALDTMVDRIAGFEILETEAVRPGVIGFFNILDHFSSPMRPLHRALDLAELVLVSLHAFGWTDLQHKHNIGPGFPRLLRDGGVSVVDLTGCLDDRSDDGQAGDGRRRYLAMSRSMDVAAALLAAGYAVEGDVVLGVPHAGTAT